jgi:hypothetical protein
MIVIVMKQPYLNTERQDGVGIQAEGTKEGTHNNTTSEEEKQEFKKEHRVS